jgi:hypothetical protein
MLYNILHGVEVSRYDDGDIKFTASYGYIFIDHHGVYDIELFNICKSKMEGHEIFRHFAESDLRLLMRVQDMNTHDAELYIKRKQVKKLASIYKEMPMELVHLISSYISPQPIIVTALHS